MSSSSSLHLGQIGDSTSQHDAVATANSMPRAACMLLFFQELFMFEQRGDVCPAIQACSQFVSCSLLPQLLLNRSSEGLPETLVIDSHSPSLQSPSVAFGIFPGCAPNGNPIVLYECDNDSLQRTAGLLAIIGVAFFAHTFPIWGLILWLLSQQHKPLSDERDLDC